MQVHALIDEFLSIERERFAHLSYSTIEVQTDALAVAGATTDVIQAMPAD